MKNLMSVNASLYDKIKEIIPFFNSLCTLEAETGSKNKAFKSLEFNYKNAELSVDQYDFYLRSVLKSEKELRIYCSLT